MAEKCTKHGDNPIYHPVPTIQPGPEIGRNLCRVKGRCEGKYGGYREDILTENLNERDKVGFICTICEGIMNEACISSSEEQFCSCCRNIYSHIKETSNVPVRKMINTLKCCCPSIERGCEWLGTLKDCENHLDTCGYVYVSCKLKCGVVLRRDKLEKHANECSHRQVKCDHCKKDFKSGELNRHLNKCPEMKVSCDLCNTQITREDMPQHLEHDCGMVQETCILGCGVKITRNGLKAHVKYTCVQRKITCEHCDISVKFCDNPRHLRECPKVKVPCDLCGTQITRENMSQHLKHDCAMVEETCPLGCGAKLTRSELKIHVKDTCVQRKITCEHCDISLKFCDYCRHLEECPKVKVLCDLCNTQLTREDMPQHLKHDCGMVQETCPLRCGAKLTRNELKIHVKDTCVQRKITCEHCNISLKFCDYCRHLEECPKVKVLCDLCNTQLTREDMPQHLKHDCGMVQETCPLRCGAKLTRNELKIHVKDTCVQRKITCEHCNISLKFCDYCRHLEECPKVKVPCDLCNTQITREDMPQHLKHDCGMVQETCQLGCGAKLTRNELKMHEKDTCVQRKITCEHCDISVKFCDYCRHLKECPKVKVTCEQCREVKYRKDMTEHFKDYCPEKMLECPFVKYKCMTRIRRKDMDNHLEEKETKHLGLKLTVMEDLISQQSEEFTKQNEEIIKQNEEIIKQSEEIKKLIDNNEKQNIEMMMEKENTSQQFRLLCSITETTKIIWKIKDVTNLTKKRLLESALYTVAGYRFRLQFLMDSLTIVFPETASKHVKPFIAKCTIVLSTKHINCGMLEAKQKDLTRGCVRNITSISQQDIDEYSQPISPESLMKDLTLEIYLTMQ